MSAGTETKTIMEFLSENPDVDVSRAWERCWKIHSGIVDRIRARFDVSLHPSCAGEDYFQFTLQAGFVDEQLALEEMDKIAVVPNPYIVAASWEPRTQIQGRGPRLVQFIHLPEKCTIKIYTIRGELVKRIEHDGTGGDGAEWWDLKTDDNQEIAYGVYLFHVNAPDVGEKVGKFAIVK